MHNVMFATLTPSPLSTAVMNGTWSAGSTEWTADQDNIVLNAMMDGIHAVFIMFVPIMGLCLLGCAFISDVRLKGDNDRTSTIKV